MKDPLYPAWDQTAADLAADPAAAPSEPSSHEGATRSTLGPPPPPPRAPSSSYVTHTNEKLRRSKLEADRRRARARRQRAAGAHSASGQSLFRTGTAPSTPRAASPRASPPSTPWQKIPDLTRGANTGTRARATRPTRSMSSRGITRPGVPGAPGRPPTSSRPPAPLCSPRPGRRRGARGGVASQRG